MAGVILELGRCGFGSSGALFPEVRLGWVRICGYRGGLIGRLHDLASALSQSRETLRAYRADEAGGSVVKSAADGVSSQLGGQGSDELWPLFWEGRR